MLPLEVGIFRGGRDGLRLVAFRGFSDPTGIEEWGLVLGWGTLPAWGRSTAELFSLRWYSMGDCSAARENRSQPPAPNSLARGCRGAPTGGMAQTPQTHRLQTKQEQEMLPMEAHGALMARQDTSTSHCAVHELNTALHADVKNSFSNYTVSRLKYLPFIAYIIALIFFEITQINHIL